MSTIALRPQLPVVQEFTPEQIDLIKSTVAKGATDDELKLFLYRCQKMELDPLKPGQIYFIKYGSNPGTIVVGLDGFRVKALRTGKHVGTRREVIRDDKGKAIGAWCEIDRADWRRPAREEVSLAEYNTGKAQWAKMPETMIKKVAEAAALRMAFPDELGGIYAEEEMHQAEPRDVKAQQIQEKLNAEPQVVETTFEPEPIKVASKELAADYIIKVGKNKGKQIKDLTSREIDNFLTFYDAKGGNGEKMHPEVTEYWTAVHRFLAEREGEY